MDKRFCGLCDTWTEKSFLEHNEECLLIRSAKLASQVEELKERIRDLEYENDRLEGNLEAIKDAHAG